MNSTHVGLRGPRFHAPIKRVIDEILLPAGIRSGSMFGHPGYYVGRKLVACHYGRGLAIRLPEKLVESLLLRRRAKPFRPYGKAPMRHWVLLHHARAEDFRTDRKLLMIAVRLANSMP
ncbi:MAG TPA: hypothetical protein VFX67_08230 [Burkholderiales bacterium]|nr:hypothetical protein [Burkholderiales bacterium]